MSRSETVLVTGGAGFIGSHLVEALLAEGRQVVVFDNFNDFYAPALKQANVVALQAAARCTGAGLRVLKGDLRSSSDVERAVACLGPAETAAVVHLAAMAGVRPSIEQPRLYQAVNIDGTLNLLEACLPPACGAWFSPPPPRSTATTPRSPLPKPIRSMRRSPPTP